MTPVQVKDLRKRIETLYSGEYRFEASQAKELRDIDNMVTGIEQLLGDIKTLTHGHRTKTKV